MDNPLPLLEVEEISVAEFIDALFIRADQNSSVSATNVTQALKISRFSGNPSAVTEYWNRLGEYRNLRIPMLILHDFAMQSRSN